MSYKKPPLGVSPHWYIYNKRIKELGEAIIRYADFTMENINLYDTKEYYALIAKWATEIKLLAEAEVQLEKGDEK